ncbi:hypothetical protein MLD38_000612 [Melastoma candidum]|uniref:Uncharacterized protein n=1 Tax=Melastoma candidum TaxID=119954 RepID=A0ACB9SAQ5_9MYRT|nr:hypothetical protein MLD38_000612 [Melastoma candidum]
MDSYQLKVSSNLMDSSKKRKVDENGMSLPDHSVPGDGLGAMSSPVSLYPSELRKILDHFSKDQLVEILQDATLRHPDVLASVRSVADPDATQRKLFIRGLGWDTTTDGLRSLFSTYGEIEEAVVILDKNTGKSKGYGFVTFRHVDGAVLALREPSKKIDGRVTVTQLAAAGNSGSNTNSSDVANRKIYVANVPSDISSDKLLSHFSFYGEIEEGPLGFDKQTGKSRGFALFVYKAAEGAQAALIEPIKNIDGKQMSCKLAIDGKKKPGDGHADGMTMGMGHMGAGGFHGPVPGQYGQGGMVGYGYPSGGQPPMGQMNSVGGLGGQGMASLGSNPPSSMGSVAGYGGYGGPGAGGYGGGGFSGMGVGSSGGMGGGMVSGGYTGGAAAGVSAGSGMYRPTGGYPEGAAYGLNTSGGYPSQVQQPTGTSPVPRVPQGGMYPNPPPYY